jgi:hypothetical protein
MAFVLATRPGSAGLGPVVKDMGAYSMCISICRPAWRLVCGAHILVEYRDPPAIGAGDADIGGNQYSQVGSGGIGFSPTGRQMAFGLLPARGHGAAEFPRRCNSRS